MVDDDALTYKGFWCGDSGDSLENYSVKVDPLAGIQDPVEGSRIHRSGAARLPSALPMKTHWSMSARLSANRGSVWLSEGVFGIGFEDLISSGQVRMRPSITGFGIGNHVDCRWR